jgi:hypothetical protein
MYRKINDLRDLGEHCGNHCVARLIRPASPKS